MGIGWPANDCRCSKSLNEPVPARVVAKLRLESKGRGGKSVTEQTREILSTIDGYLKKAGTDKSKLLTANIWLANMDTFAEMNAVWDKWAVAGKTPARATVEARLADPSWKIEIMVEAAV